LERHEDGRGWRRGGDSGVQPAINGDEPVESVKGEDLPDGLGGDRQPQLGTASGGALVGARHGGRAFVITRSGSGHVDNQLGDAAVDDPQQFLAYLGATGVADVPRKN
jgi:hypothetical protein